MSQTLSYNPRKPLFIPTKKQFSLADAEQALEIAYGKGNPVLIYIHGRAKGIGEPRKSLEQGIYKSLKKYGVSVVGFTWDADDGGYDESRPIASTGDFDQFLDTLGAYLESHPDSNKPSLLAHSMGNIIISELAKDDRLGNERGQLFENIVLSAPAVKRKRHHRWLASIGVSRRNYVMVNPNDTVLEFAGFLLKPDMLGEELKSPGVSPEQAVYVNLGDLNVKHRYFAKPKQKHLQTFFTQAFTGQAADFGQIAYAGDMGGVPVQTIKPDEGKKKKGERGGGSQDPFASIPPTD